MKTVQVTCEALVIPDILSLCILYNTRSCEVQTVIEHTTKQKQINVACIQVSAFAGIKVASQCQGRLRLLLT